LGRQEQTEHVINGVRVHIWPCKDTKADVDVTVRRRSHGETGWDPNSAIANDHDPISSRICFDAVCHHAIMV
jgi:hypothetical protein